MKKRLMMAVLASLVVPLGPHPAEAACPNACPCDPCPDIFADPPINPNPKQNGGEGL